MLNDFKKIIFFLLLISFKSNAITSNTLFLVADSNDKGIYTLLNNDKDRVYIKTKMLRVDVSDNKVNKTVLNRDNINLWNISIDPGKFVLNPGEMKNVGVRYLCKDGCNQDRDEIYQFQFLPVDNPNIKKDNNSVNIRFSVAPYFVIPAKNQHVDFDYDFDKKNNNLTINNKGNTFLKFEVNNCNKYKSEKSCRSVYFSLAKQKKVIKLPESLVSSHTLVKVANYDQSVQREFSL